jgi:hypothetical protein
MKSGKGCEDQEWPKDILMGVEMEKKGDGLYGLSKAHLVSQDGVSVLVPIFY